MAETSLPEPLVPPNCDVRSMPYMPLEVARLRDSQLVIRANGDAFRAAVLLWCAAWHQVPAGSLPADDDSLAHYAFFGRDIGGWQEIKEEALRGFRLCSDGRFYHPVICDRALVAWASKEAQEIRREKERKRGQQRRASEKSGADAEGNSDGRPRDEGGNGAQPSGQRPTNVQRMSSGNPPPNITEHNIKNNAPPSAHLPDMNDPKVQLFHRGKQILGSSGGGLITKLLKSVDDSVPKARAALETASEKADPREYLAAIANKKPPPEAGKRVRRSAI